MRLVEINRGYKFRKVKWSLRAAISENILATLALLGKRPGVHQVTRKFRQRYWNVKISRADARKP